ncbi:type II toxin-antitoxin system RelE/ParE family toxin [Candidatus Peregrinibacteria bacterium]|jgi:mRNA interferase RelE/StbE|nr:type II toxin-antitoxin system RelE/ParE family toxin [Candidatus Peregrinibacteria bacterium]MBT4148471.1 type II toxin-antitoxin system RelE/ParE family toxin [Candidatus Peregrinibacteria bacterium]
MTHKLVYTKKAFADLASLTKQDTKRILEKISYFSKQQKPLNYAVKLKDPKYGTYRFRIGNYRAIFDIDKNGNIHVLLILAIKHRKNIYKL